MCPAAQSFGYKFPDFFMEYGPLEAADLDSARLLVRRRLGVTRLPRGMVVWNLADRPLARWRADWAS